jgi:hypothetical protein
MYLFAFIKKKCTKSSRGANAPHTPKTPAVSILLLASFHSDFISDWCVRITDQKSYGLPPQQHTARQAKPQFTLELLFRHFDGVVE